MGLECLFLLHVSYVLIIELLIYDFYLLKWFYHLLSLSLNVVTEHFPYFRSVKEHAINANVNFCCNNYTSSNCLTTKFLVRWPIIQ